jgi:hypothetical protein
MPGNPTKKQKRQVKQAIEAMSRATQEPTGEQERQAIEEAMERHWIRHEEAVKLIRDHFNCTEGWAIQKLREAETSGAVQFYRPGPPDYIEDEKAAIYCEVDLKYWLNPTAAPASPAKSKRGKGGRRPVVNWTMADQEVHRLMDHHSEFSVDDPKWNARARLEEAVGDFCETTFGIRPSETALKVHVGKSLEQWRQRSET